MLSPQKIAANRRNSLKSTGPRTTEGKIASSRNAVKTGIDSYRPLLAGESPESLAAVAARWRSQYPDPTPQESAALEGMILNGWFLRRLIRIEVELNAHEEAAGIRTDLPVGCSARSGLLRAAATRNDQFRRLKQRRGQVLRDFARAENQLENLRPIPSPGSSDAAQPQQNTAPVPVLGSVFRIAQLAHNFEANSQL